MEFANSTFFRNILGVVTIFIIWLIFSIVGLRGMAVGESIREIREEAGLSLLTLAIFTIAILGLVALFGSSPGTAATPFPS